MEPIAKTENLPKTNSELLKLLFLRIQQKRKWKLLPLWLLLVAVAIILFLTGQSFIVPAIYVMF